MKIVEYTYHDPKVRSSAIGELWYSSTSRELFVRFKDSGQVAGYSDVSPVAADKLVEATSIGSYYTKYIKPNYKGINTKDVEFRSAPGLAKKTTTAKTYGHGTTGITKPVAAVVPAKPKKTFRVVGTVLKPVTQSETFVTDTLEQAIEMFRQMHAGKEPDVIGVSVN